MGKDHYGHSFYVLNFLSDLKEGNWFSFVFCDKIIVWSDDTWLSEHAGQTLEKTEEGEQEDEKESEEDPSKRPLEDSETVVYHSLLIDKQFTATVVNH